MIIKKNISKIFLIFLTTHLFIWTLIPSISNVNLPLDTIEALAWGSNLEWGYNKHPPLSAFAVNFIYYTFGPNDWAYYFLSQIFIIVTFIYVWKLGNEILKDKLLALISLLILEGIYFYNFTTPEFNVNVSQLPFWAMTTFYFWRSINHNMKKDWILFGVLSAFGFLSKYLFIYILFSFFIFIFFNLEKNKKLIKNYLLSIIISLLILLPHFIWLFENDFVTIVYGLNRSNLTDTSLLDHFLNPANFLIKQTIILIPFFLMIVSILKKIRFKINLNEKKNFFIFSITLFPAYHSSPITRLISL